MFKPKLLAVMLISAMLMAACSGSATQAPAYTAPTAQPAANTTAPTATQAPTATPTQAPAPTKQAVLPATGGVDWMLHGFPTILTSQSITPGTATTITTGPYTIQVPADAFTEAVTFNVLSGDPSSFKAPSGETPILAFAFNVKNSQGQFVVKFNKPVTLTVKDSAITNGSQYYNVAADGALSPNPTGLTVQSGQLTHPIAGTPVGWVITTPASAATTPQATTVQVANNPTLGKILVDSQGMTLYTFKNDKPNQSNCTGGCAKLWPPLTVAQGTTPTAGSGVTGKLGIIQRQDGSYQVTYNSMPLYLYSQDTASGMTKGQGLLNLWYVVPPSSSSASGNSNGSSSSSGSNGSGGSGGY